MVSRLLFICTILCWLGAPGMLSAQSAPGGVDVADRRWHPQFDLFQLLLEEQGVRTFEDLRRVLSAPPVSALVITSEDGSVTQLRRSEMLDFVDQGGIIILMCELNSGPNVYSDFKGIGTFFNGPVTSVRSLDRYQNHEDCLQIRGLNDPQDLFPGVKTIVTNRGDWFEPISSPRWQWQKIATYPNTTYPTSSQQRALIAVGQPSTVSIDSLTASPGMFVVMADSSLLTNGMLWHGDNAKLALRIGELLKRQKRTQLAFLHNGRLLSSATERLAEKIRNDRNRLNANNMPLPEPSLERMLRLGNAIAREVADSNVLNEALAQQPRHVSPHRYFRVLLAALIVAGLLYGLWKLLTSRRLREMWLARRRMRHAFEIVSGNEAGDYRTAASYLAREFCIQWTGSHHSSDWQQALAVLLIRSPAILAEDKQQLTRIVDIASRGCHEPMPGLQFQHFGRTLAQLRNYIAVTAS